MRSAASPNWRARRQARRAKQSPPDSLGRPLLLGLGVASLVSESLRLSGHLWPQRLAARPLDSPPPLRVRRAPLGLFGGRPHQARRQLSSSPARQLANFAPQQLANLAPQKPNHFAARQSLSSSSPPLPNRRQIIGRPSQPEVGLSVNRAARQFVVGKLGGSAASLQ